MRRSRSFKSRHPKRPVIPLIIAGKPDDPELECFPPALKFKVDAKGRIGKKRLELLAADAREQGDGKAARARQGRGRAARCHL